MLNTSDLMRVAPSIFTEEPSSRVSEDYKMIRTYDIVNALGDIGYFPVAAGQSKTRIAGRSPYVKHMLRMRHKDAYQPTGEHRFFERGTEPIVPEAVIWNSHDGTSAYHISFGIFSFVCSNGLVVKQADFGGLRVLHKGDIVQAMVDGLAHIHDTVPKLIQYVNQWRSVEVGNEELFATKMLLARYGDLTKSPIMPHTLMSIRRQQDDRKDLWTVFNKMQENIMKGGLTSGLRGDKRQRTTRRIRGVNETLRFNSAAWEVAEQEYNRLIGRLQSTDIAETV